MMLYDILVVKIFNLILPFHFLWGKVSKGRLEHRGYHNSHIWKCEVACFLQLKNVLQIPWGFSRLLNVFFSIFSALSISNLSRLSVKKGHKSNSLPTTLCFLSKIRKKKLKFLGRLVYCQIFHSFNLIQCERYRLFAESFDNVIMVCFDNFIII